MAFFKKLKERLFKSSSKLDEGLEAIVEDGGEADAGPPLETAPASPPQAAPENQPPQAAPDTPPPQAAPPLRRNARRRPAF